MIDQLILKIKRGDSPFYRFIRQTANTLLHNSMPVPKPLQPVFRLAYGAHFGVRYGMRWLLAFFYRGPLFQSLCASVGKNLHVWLLPVVRGRIDIHVGDNVNFYGDALIESKWSGGSVPKLIVGNRVDLGHTIQFIVQREVVIDDDVKIAGAVKFMDSDEFSTNAEDARPIHVCRYAWIGQDAYILKGVTIGEGAIVGVNSVVTSDIPPYSVAMGNPARVVVKNAGRSIVVEPASQAS